MKARWIKTAESVTAGHPDKIADQVADAVVDAVLAQDVHGRCGCEVLVNSSVIVVSGEFNPLPALNPHDLVVGTIRRLGYCDPALGFTADSCSVVSCLRPQSQEIASVVTNPVAERTGASDQGIVYGYASDETDTLMPMPIFFANRLVKQLDCSRFSGSLPYLRPDGKSQVSVEYRDGQPYRIACVVIAAQHDPGVSIDTVRRDVLERVIRPVVPEALMDNETRVVVNAFGRFVEGGPKIDTGVTGRKLVADTYGGASMVGGGALSGKDPSKIDRTAAYYGRYVAKNIVAAGLARRCSIEIAYAFGEVDPVATTISTFGTGSIPEDNIVQRVIANFDFRPAKMLEALRLRRPMYSPTSVYGCFGWPEYPWESTDKADVLKG
jgi:S-adenosylmethionine synthetase